MSDIKEFVKEIQLTPYEASQLRVDVRGRGKTQSLLRKLQFQLGYNNRLKLTKKDIDSILQICEGYSNGGITEREYHNQLQWYRQRLDVIAIYLENEKHKLELEQEM